MNTIKVVYNLKKSLSILAGFLLILMFAACGKTADPVKESASKSEGGNDKEKTEETSDLTLEEVFNISTEASESLKRFTVKMDMNQNMSTGKDDQEMNITSEINMDVITDPMTFYQKMKMRMEGAEESFDTESYFTEEG